MLTNLLLSIGGVLVYVARADLTSYSMERERGSSYVGVGRVEAPNDAYLELGKNILLATVGTR